MAFAESDHVSEKTENILIGSQLAPVEPSGFVVLVVRIVIAELCVQKLVAGTEHCDPVGEHEQAEKILNLLAPQRQNFIGRALVALVTTVPTIVGVHPVLVVVAVRPVMLLVV